MITRLLVLTVAFIALVASYVNNVSTVKFHIDESFWIATSNQYDALVHLRFRDSVFAESYWARTQPPMARYVFGIGRQLSGGDTQRLPCPWHYEVDSLANVRLGCMPTTSMLLGARIASATVAAVGTIAIAAIVWEMAGVVAAASWVAMIATSPYFRRTFRRAMGEGTLLLWVALALLAAWRALALPATVSPKRTLAWFIIAGLATGFAAATKLNGGAVYGGLVMAAFLLAWRHTVHLSNSARVRRFVYLSALWAAGAGASAGLAFVGSYPYLWPHPISRSVGMFIQRVSEMTSQVSAFPLSHVAGVNQRLQLWFYSLTDSMRPIPMLGPWTTRILILLGFVFLVLRLRSYRPARGAPAAEALILGLAPLVVLGLFSPLSWDRYLVFPAMAIAFLMAIAVGTSVMALVTLARRALH